MKKRTAIIRASIRDRQCIAVQFKGSGVTALLLKIKSRFADKNSHQIFIEPEANTNEFLSKWDSTDFLNQCNLILFVV